jgi:hypothetical protein
MARVLQNHPFSCATISGLMAITLLHVLCAMVSPPLWGGSLAAGLALNIREAS